MRPIAMIFVLMSTLLLLSCEDTETGADGNPINYEFALFRIDSNWLPSTDVDMLAISVTGPGVVESSWDIYKKDMPMELQVALAESAEWLLSLEAWNSDMEQKVAEAEKSFSQPLVLELLDLHWQMDASIIALYTFGDPWLSDWGGTANMSLEDGTLKIQSTGQTAYRYHIYDHADVGEHATIIAKFDLQFSDNKSYMNFKVHAPNGLQDWGPEILFQNGYVVASSACRQ